MKHKLLRQMACPIIPERNPAIHGLGLFGLANIIRGGLDTFLMKRSGHMARLLGPLLLVSVVTTLEGATNETMAEDYTPYLNGHPWPRFPVTAYVETPSNIWVHPQAPKRFPRVTEIRDPDADFTTVVIALPDGSRYKTYNNPVLGPFFAAVYSGDFNGDGKPDFVAIKPGGGCGLAAEYCTGVFAFSDDTDYRFRRITTMGLGPHDLVIDPRTKTFRLIHTSFRQGQSLDGKIHSFWVHRFYKWADLRLERDENLPTTWIQFLNRPNHEPTKLLTLKLKEKAWNEDAESGARIDW